jgi:hypothetical protein
MRYFKKIKIRKERITDIIMFVLFAIAIAILIIIL